MDAEDKETTGDVDSSPTQADVAGVENGLSEPQVNPQPPTTPPTNVAPDNGTEPNKGTVYRRVEEIPPISATISESPPPLGGTIDEKREHVREYLAKFLVKSLVAFLLISLTLIATANYTGLLPETLKMYFDPILAALITLVSTVVGFYYGAGSNTQK